MLPICIYLISNTFLHDLTTIRLRAHEGHPRGRAEHLLLDPLHLHHPQRLLEADRWAGHSGHDEGDDGDCAGIDVAHPGIDKTIDPEERRYVRYYQWVCFCLFFQVSTSSEKKVYL